MSILTACGDDGSGVVNTSWALVGLAAAQHEDVEAVKRGIAYLLQRQLPCGDCPQEGIAVVFNRACGMTYTNYHNILGARTLPCSLWCGTG
jgi:squalene cyclase